MSPKFSSRSWVRFLSSIPIRRQRRENPVDKTVVNTLPVELLLHIFWEAYASTDDKYNRIPIVLRLGQVCGHWRAIVHSHDEFWATFGVSDKPRHSLSILQLCLRNSTSHLLDFRATLVPKSFWDLRSAYRAIILLQELVKHCARWEHAKFITDSASPLLNIPPGSLKELVSVSFSVPKGFMPLAVQKFWNNTCQPAHTQLRSVSWKDSGMVSLPPHTPWHQLVHVEFHFFATLHDVVKIIPLCQSLESLSIADIWVQSISSPLVEEVVPLLCPGLKELSIGGSPLTDISPLLNQLTAPNLHTIKIKFSSEIFKRTIFPSNSLFDMLTRSRCLLRCLEFRGFRINQDVEQVPRYLKASFSRTLNTLYLGCRLTPEIADCMHVLPHISRLSGLFSNSDLELLRKAGVAIAQQTYGGQK